MLLARERAFRSYYGAESCPPNGGQESRKCRGGGTLEMGIKQVRVDDLDGSVLGDDATTIVFGFAGIEYEIDLNGEHAAQFKAGLQAYIEAARPRTDGATSPPTLSRRQRTANLRAVRDWAKARGYQISDRGRVPRLVIEEYERRGIEA